MRMRNDREYPGPNEKGEVSVDEKGEIAGSAYFAWNGRHVVCPPKNDPLGRRNTIEIPDEALKTATEGRNATRMGVGTSVFFGNEAERRDAQELQAARTVGEAMATKRHAELTAIADALAKKEAEIQKREAALEAKVAKLRGPREAPPEA